MKWLMRDKQSKTVNGPGATEGKCAEIPVLKTKDLFLQSREVMIQHNNEIYHLRLTKSGKLILNK